MSSSVGESPLLSARAPALVLGALLWCVGACSPGGIGFSPNPSPDVTSTDTSEVPPNRSDNEVPPDARALDKGPEETDGSGDVGIFRPDDVPTGDASPNEDSTDAVNVDIPAEGDEGPWADGLSCPEGALCDLPYNYACKEGRCNAQGACIATDIPGCCYSVSDCDEVPLAPCEEVQCVSKECTAIKVPGCCSDDLDCKTPLACVQSTCNKDSGRCVFCPGNCPCTPNPNVQLKSFDSPTLSGNGFSMTDYNSNDKVKWQVDSTRSFKGLNSLYIGDPECRTYYTGKLTDGCLPLTAGQDAAAVRVALYSPVMNLSNSDGSAGSAVLFWYWAEVEPDLGLGLGEPDVLRAFVDVLDGTGVKWKVASTAETGKNTYGAWVPVAIDLAPYTGTLSRLRLEFDTFDGQLNNYEGIYLDEFQVKDKCEGSCCQVDADCPNSGDPCSKPICVPLVGGSGSICTEAPKTLNCQACGTDSDCADDNPCTTNTCSEEGTCSVEVFCCYASTVFKTSFEVGLDDWLVSDETPADNVTWQTTAIAASDGGLAAWFGDSSTSTYATGSPVKGSILSPDMALPVDFVDGGMLQLSFDVRLDTEWDGLFYLNPLGIDRLSLEIHGAGAPKELWSSDDVSGTTKGAWQKQSIDLTPFAGQTIQLKFIFDSGDGNANDFAGPFIDHLLVARTCP